MGAGVRDSKDPTGPVLIFTPSKCDAFIGACRTASSARYHQLRNPTSRAGLLALGRRFAP
ncbi:DUF397 domain-containing protein [Nonomuraea sp. NPDC049714]|uniref:DUF397 domain-containing protein n=1 Tax=Nonomuraea sp. NPDC049714 TaxID=3364357 RepID=UPI0037939D5E